METYPSSDSFSIVYSICCVRILAEIKKIITKFTNAITYFLLFFYLISTYSDINIHPKQIAPEI